jgi:hypothetical protein
LKKLSGDSTQNRRAFLIRGAVAFALPGLGWASPASAACTICRTTSLLLPLSGIAFAPIEPCVPTGERVSLAGNLHVVTTVHENWVMDIHLDMAGVDGIGQTSGASYIGTGSTKFIDLQGGPELDAITTNFTLENTNRCASVPLPVTFQLSFGNDGRLLPESNASIGGVT